MVVQEATLYALAIFATAAGFCTAGAKVYIHFKPLVPPRLSPQRREVREGLCSRVRREVSNHEAIRDYCASSSRMLADAIVFRPVRPLLSSLFARLAA